MVGRGAELNVTRQYQNMLKGHRNGWRPARWKQAGVSVLFALGGAAGALVPAGHAQQALRDSLAGESAAAALRGQFEAQPYNLRWRNLRIQTEASLRSEWNDNIGQAEKNPESDFLLTPRLDIDAVQPVGRFNGLRLSAGIGYEKHFEHDELDRMQIVPGSALSFDFFVKDVRITLHERFSYDHSPGRSAAVSGSGQFGGFDNQAGIRSVWDLKDLVVQLGYDYVTFASSSDQFAQTDRQSHQLSSQAAFQVHPTVNVGIELAGGPTAYDKEFLNDSLGMSAGVFGRWQISDYISIETRGGYSRYSFSDNSIRADLPDVDGYYLGFNAQHRVNEWLTYHFDATRVMQLGVYANLQESWVFGFQPSFNVVRNTTLAPRIAFEHGAEKGGGQEQEYDRFTASLALSYQLARKLSVGVQYVFANKESNLGGFDYQQNRVAVTLGYHF